MILLCTRSHNHVYFPPLSSPFPSQGQAHVPFRDSKLTRLLQQTLAGNSKTAVIVGIIPERYGIWGRHTAVEHPAPKHLSERRIVFTTLFTLLTYVNFAKTASRDELGETLATLIFAQRAMSVTTEAHANVVPDLEARCQDLQQQYDNQSDKLTQMTLMKASAEERLELAHDQLAQLQEEKNATDVRLQTMVEAYEMLTVIFFVQERLFSLGCPLHGMLPELESTWIFKPRGRWDYIALDYLG